MSMQIPSDTQTDHHLINVDGYGTSINSSSAIYHDYMTRWKPQSRFILWVNAMLFAGYKAWEAYDTWQKAKLPKHRPIGIEDR